MINIIIEIWTDVWSNSIGSVIGALILFGVSWGYKKFNRSKKVIVTFQNSLSELIIKPKFQKTIKKNIQKLNSYEDDYLGFIPPLQNGNIGILKEYSMSGKKENLSYCRLSFQMKNISNKPIEHYKVLFEIEGEIQDLAKYNEEYIGIIQPISYYKSDIIINQNKISGEIEPDRSILVGGDFYNSRNLFIKPYPKEYEISVKWNLVSRDFKDEGRLKIIIKPEFEEKEIYILVSDPLNVGIIEKSDFQDVIVTT